MSTLQEIAAANVFLGDKLRQYVAQCNVPALAAVLVRDAGSTIVSAQQGIRKVGASGYQNVVQDTDRFNIASISKILAAHLIGAMIDAKTPGLSWGSTLGSVMPDLSFPVPFYKDMTIDQYTGHVSAMPYTPSNEPTGVYEPANDAPGLAALNLNAIQRRLVYVQKALQDPPVPDYQQRAPCWLYSGGQVINAAMLERLTGQAFEDLIQKYVFGPLQMTRSRFGRAFGADDNGPWQHFWNPATYQVTPVLDWQDPAADTQPRNPVGGMCCNAADLGRFLAESIRPDPQLFEKPTLQQMQTVMAPGGTCPPCASEPTKANSSYTRGAWSSSDPGSFPADLNYEGDNGRVLAWVTASLSKPIPTAIGAMCNVTNTLAYAGVNDMLATVRAFDANWEDLFGVGAPEPRECSHNMPALVASGDAGQSLTVFARKRDGLLVCRQSGDGGKNWNPEIAFPAWIMTSGLSAAVTQDGSQMFLFGRGTDNQVWFGKSSDGGQTWQGPWAVPFGTFMTGPAVALSANGQNIGLHLVAIGMDRRMYYIYSADGGKTWGPSEAITDATFTSGPAIAVSNDGNLIHVFGRGDDFRMYRNWSTDAGGGFEPLWVAIGFTVMEPSPSAFQEGIFTSGPGATASRDGSRVHVIGRGTDRDMWHNWTTGLQQPFQSRWMKLNAGTFMSAPALAVDIPGQNIYLAAFGDDFTLYTNHTSVDAGPWDGSRRVTPNPGLFI